MCMFSHDTAQAGDKNLKNHGEHGPSIGVPLQRSFQTLAAFNPASHSKPLYES